MKVLSLFDGISCGYVALLRAGIPVDDYSAFEINDDSIKVSQQNFPSIHRYGNVIGFDYKQFFGYDLLIGGSPCSWWSNARANRSDIERHPNGIGYALFEEYIRALNESCCRYFLYENNYSISQEIKEKISSDLGVDFIMINSSLVSAQNRMRCYWTNIPTTLPDDKHIMLSDVISGAVNGAAERNQKTKQGVLPFLNIRKDGKSNCLISYMSNRNCRVQLLDGSTRPLTADEFELLQTLPQGYTSVLSENKRKSVVALGWTVDVISHIFKGLKVEK